MNMFVPCPNGHLYEIREGDTLWLIARKRGITLDQLIQANPGIQHPDHLIPGQTICIPNAENSISLPCCLVLQPVENGPASAIGVALIHRMMSSPGRKTTSVDILAHGLPHPSSLGDYDSYEGFAQIPNVISWRFRLYPTPESEPTLAGRFDLITATLTSNTIVQVRLSDSMSGQLGPAVLQNMLQHCG